MTVRIVAGSDVIPELSLSTILLIITRSHLRAERIVAARGIAGEWRQFNNREIAELWIDRCVERGCELEIRWLFPA